MRIVLNHITRMKEGRICIAGLAEHADEHVRPTTRLADPLTRALLRENGGPVSVSAMIDIGDARPVPTLPESEDHLTTTRDLRYVRTLDGDEYLERLSRVSGDGLEAVFGPALQRATPWKYAMDEGRGSRSLGVMRLPAGSRLDADARFGGVTLMFREDGKPVYTRVADARFFDDHGAVGQDVVDDVARAIEVGDRRLRDARPQPRVREVRRRSAPALAAGQRDLSGGSSSGLSSRLRSQWRSLSVPRRWRL